MSVSLVADVDKSAQKIGTNMTQLKPATILSHVFVLLEAF